MQRPEPELPGHADPIRDNRSAAAILDIARAFVGARLAAAPLAAFPGTLPADLSTAYAVQNAALGLWQDRIVGWKVGLIPPPAQAGLGAARLAGPIFNRGLIESAAGPVNLAAIQGGFAAIEAELLVAARADAPAKKTQWTVAEAAEFAGEWHLGMEFAASPLATINELGAAAVVCDFGNNSGIVLGPRLDSALIANPDQLIYETKIDGRPVGFASAAALPGGPLEALRFVLGHLAERGRSLCAGQWVSTGAITGVHQIFPGQHGSIELIGHGRIDVRVNAAVAAGAQNAAGRRETS
jgi:2-keto-4-pentenoate hydratase